MLDIGFSELMLCFVVALVVLGPERLPGVARAVGRWAGKARGYVRNLNAELERETHIVEMKKQVEDAHRILREESRDVQTSVESGLKAAKEEARVIGAVTDNSGGAPASVKPEASAPRPHDDPYGA